MNFQSKVMKKLAKFHKDSGGNFEENLLKTYVEETEQPKPTTKANFVGVEFECFSPRHHSKAKIAKTILERDLEDYIHIDDDGSLTGPGISHEIKLLIPETKLKDLLLRFGKIIKEHELTTNRTCGLHIHLDMRNRDYKACLARLNKFKHLLFHLVEGHRWNNSYCRFDDQGTLFLRRSAINPTSYAKHKSIEIRLHHGTTNIDQIYKWIRLLLNIINTKSEPASFTKTGVLQWAGLRPHLRKYVDENWHDGWRRVFNRLKRQRDELHTSLAENNMMDLDTYRQRNGIQSWD
jgi:hypothetical protein